ncbi:MULTISPECIES: HyaD/HybD family hydrogenase maturation endopeptidase [unclassified Shewanella]|uniref:HyaD/HybD family hydrogenase maturation endopeptidase n=1 Tax=unclassified Shewanella TaxID=196818 RepID=UPI0006D65699|nr:HyaD/HybD family hydrogenase maturation endopeptidase [Shewanella sp. P1-14-1]KPZ71503.1 Hydrogenase 2 maturation protease [Shewanella sp. P1-14-1]
MTSTLLIGIGNVLYADEGIGVHFVNYIQEKYQFYHPNITLDLLDGGTLAQGLIPILCRYDNLIVVDTVNSPGVQPGEVYSFNFDQAPPEIDWQGSAHEVEMLQTLIMMEMVGDRPNTHVIGVTPTVIEPMTLGLTPQIQAAVPVMEQALLKHLSFQGFSSKCIAEVDINSLIPDSYKRGANMYA